MRGGGGGGLQGPVPQPDLIVAAFYTDTSVAALKASDSRKNKSLGHKTQTIGSIKMFDSRKRTDSC